MVRSCSSRLVLCLIVVGLACVELANAIKCHKCEGQGAGTGECGNSEKDDCSDDVCYKKIVNGKVNSMKCVDTTYVSASQGKLGECRIDPDQKTKCDCYCDTDKCDLDISKCSKGPGLVSNGWTNGMLLIGLFLSSCILLKGM